MLTGLGPVAMYGILSVFRFQNLLILTEMDIAIKMMHSLMIQMNGKILMEMELEIILMHSLMIQAKLKILM
ncbi:MAG TPA: hypothetical protein D7H84_03900, partial [Candidatus Poseidoniales archaeon]